MEEEKQLASNIIRKELSLGDWQQCALGIKDNIKRKHMDVEFIKPLYHILKNICSIYSKYNIVKWRNEFIGHGALGSDTDELFIDNVTEKAALIKKYLIECRNEYTQIVPIICIHGQEMALIGKDMAANIDTSEKIMHTAIKGFDLQFNPFSVLFEKNIYYFDSYSLWRKTTSFLNYAGGIKKSEDNKAFIKLYTELECQKLIKSSDNSSSVDESTYPAFEKDVLDKLTKVNDFYEPSYLTSWLKNLIETNSKGVFMLQMHRGTGKTTFVKALDEQGLSKIDLEDFWVRAYYINDTYLYKVSNFIDTFNNILTEDSQGNRLIRGEIKQLSSTDLGNRKKEFADIVNFYKKKFQDSSYLGRKKLLIIIDGIDEIPVGDKISIFNFIPDPEYLEEGVYILLTSRIETFEERLPQHITSRIRNLNLTSTSGVFEKDGQNTKTLMNYIKKIFQSTQVV